MSQSIFNQWASLYHLGSQFPLKPLDSEHNLSLLYEILASSENILSKATNNLLKFDLLDPFLNHFHMLVLFKIMLINSGFVLPINSPFIRQE